MKKILLILSGLILLVTLLRCAPGPNPVVGTVSDAGDVAGFGLWHGIIAFITSIVSLFSDNVHAYEVYNNGEWYNFGFLVEIGSFVASVSTYRLI
jgi:hypothetical protein